MNARRIHEVGDVTAEHDELALRNVDQIHDAPDKRHSIGRERENGADQEPIDQQLHRQYRRVEQQL